MVKYFTGGIRKRVEEVDKESPYSEDVPLYFIAHTTSSSVNSMQF